MTTTESSWLNREALLGRISLFINKPIQGCLIRLGFRQVLSCRVSEEPWNLKDALLGLMGKALTCQILSPVGQGRPHWWFLACSSGPSRWLTQNVGETLGQEWGIYDIAPGVGWLQPCEAGLCPGELQKASIWHVCGAKVDSSDWDLRGSLLPHF